MDGVHDLGGMRGFGAVQVEQDEPPFHARWEGRVHGMMLALAAGGHLRNFRYAIEQMDPVHYLTSPYYEHWLEALQRILLEGGEITEAELAAATGPPAARTDPALAERVRSLLRPLALGSPTAGDATFAVGDTVWVRRTITARHTRCPGYVRGHRGAVRRVHPSSPLHDALVEGQMESEPYYSVAFDARELWGDSSDNGSNAGCEVVVDLWESYLEPEKEQR